MHTVHVGLNSEANFGEPFGQQQPRQEEPVCVSLTRGAGAVGVLPSPLLRLRASLALEMIRHERNFVSHNLWNLSSPAHPLLMHRPDCKIAAVAAGVVIVGQSSSTSDVMVLYDWTTGVTATALDSF